MPALFAHGIGVTRHHTLRSMIHMRLPLAVISIWASFIPVAIANGLLREKALVPLLGQRAALPLSGISAGLLFFLLAYIAIPWLGALKPAGYGLIGLTWLLLTVVFEFLFGRFVAGKSWEDLLRAYDIFSGNLWLLVLLMIFVSPYLAAKLRGFVP